MSYAFHINATVRWLIADTSDSGRLLFRKQLLLTKKEHRVLTQLTCWKCRNKRWFTVFNFPYFSAATIRVRNHCSPISILLPVWDKWKVWKEAKNFHIWTECEGLLPVFPVQWRTIDNVDIARCRGFFHFILSLQFPVAAAVHPQTPPWLFGGKRSNSQVFQVHDNK